METNILLENGTNELEVLEFTIGSNHYGINVAKVREIINYQSVTPVPNSHPDIEGIFMPRDKMITAINLPTHLHLPESANKATDMMVVTNFNKLDVAFHVQTVCGIHRVSWADIIKPDSTLNGDDNGIATGIIKVKSISTNIKFLAGSSNLARP
jgi:two-component system chemotaxis response regulator CheV